MNHLRKMNPRSDVRIGLSQFSVDKETKYWLSINMKELQ